MLAPLLAWPMVNLNEEDAPRRENYSVYKVGVLISLKAQDTFSSREKGVCQIYPEWYICLVVLIFRPNICLLEKAAHQKQKLLKIIFPGKRMEGFNLGRR